MTPLAKTSSWTLTVLLIVGSGFLCAPAPKAAADGFSLNIPFLGIRIDPGYRYYDYYSPPGYYRYDYSPGYYRTYRYYDPYNPVIERRVYEEGYDYPDGTIQEETRAEDRHESYYSPGRNEAITPPRRTVERRYGPGYAETEERYEWIAPDGRRHSTTVERQTKSDRYGNTNTQTHVDLKGKEQVPDDRPEIVPNESEAKKKKEKMIHPGPHDEN